MKFVIAAIIVIGLSLGAYQLHEYWGTYRDRDPNLRAPVQREEVRISGDDLAGLPSNLNSQLQAAEQHGAAAMKEFLDAHAKEIKDPRRAWIELDYVVFCETTDLSEARRVFGKVKARVQSDSPVYPRVKQLAKTLE